MTRKMHLCDFSYSLGFMSKMQNRLSTHGPYLINIQKHDYMNILSVSYKQDKEEINRKIKKKNKINMSITNNNSNFFFKY